MRSIPPRARARSSAVGEARAGRGATFASVRAEAHPSTQLPPPAAGPGGVLVCSENWIVYKNMGPSSPKNASRSLRRALLVPQVNTGSLYRGGKGT